MNNELIKGIKTRFRAYTLGSAGSSFTYATKDEFALIEARAPNDVQKRILTEMEIFGHKYISLLHITSWDLDHCNPSDLEWILENLKPKKIEYPGYEPESDRSLNSLKLIKEYEKKKKNEIQVTAITPEFINSLNPGSSYSYSNILFNPREKFEKANDNSIVKFFRSGMFNVLSLGDVESIKIGAMLKRSSLIKEVDVLILPHHGGNSDVLSKDLLEKIDPKLAICTSNHGNQYDHPNQNVRNLLSGLEIGLYTTKSQDVIISSKNSHVGSYDVYDFKIDTNEVKAKQENLKPKKFINLRKYQDNRKNSFKSNIYRPS
ncbi:hypothetical protein [Arsenophonus nasoniae]|uniref:Uncharacterized protein n=1 Tax=Arsenophonus nasoniae TaxID=638 RepID=A0AA95G9P5_9GAMM|nr:hypothetical protein [Arsenophonus nasoniae]WGL94087.1 hypothetical protein QE207_01755 [Arsenophonus nasoniae]